MFVLAKGLPRFVRPCANHATGNLRVWVVIASFACFLQGIESFPLVASLQTTTARATNHFHHCDFPLDTHCWGQQASNIQRHRRFEQQQRTSSAILFNSGDDMSGSGGDGGGVLESIGLASQPVVWISLYSLATTGHGLPAGPGGAIGAVEGIAYLVVVVLALLPGDRERSSIVDVRNLSRASIALGLVVLAGVAASKGCVPNAKPILDYSAYLPVCGPES